MTDSKCRLPIRRLFAQQKSNSNALIKNSFKRRKNSSCFFFIYFFFSNRCAVLAFFCHPSFFSAGISSCYADSLSYMVLAKKRKEKKTRFHLLRGAYILFCVKGSSQGQENTTKLHQVNFNCVVVAVGGGVNPSSFQLIDVAGQMAVIRPVMACQP